MPGGLDSFQVVLFLVLQVGLLLVAFFVALSRRLPARLRRPTYFALAVQWLVLLGFAFFLVSWPFGLLSILLSPAYYAVARPAADRYASRFRR